MTREIVGRKSKFNYLWLALFLVALLNYLRFILGIRLPDPVVEGVIRIDEITWQNRWFADFLVPLFVIYWLGVCALAVSIVQQAVARMWTGRWPEGYLGCFGVALGGMVLSGFSGPYNVDFVLMDNPKVAGMPIFLLLFMTSFMTCVSVFYAMCLLLEPETLIHNAKVWNR